LGSSENIRGPLYQGGKRFRERVKFKSRCILLIRHFSSCSGGVSPPTGISFGFFHLGVEKEGTIRGSILEEK